MPVPFGMAPGGLKIVADMGEQHGVDILEHAGAHHVGLAAQKLLGDPRPDHQRAGELFALHQVLDRERRDDVDGLSGIVALAMAGRALDQLLAIGDAGLLRDFGKAVDVAAERDDRMAGAPARDPGGRHAGDAALDGEAVLLEHVGQIFRGLEFLVGEFAEAEHGVVHHLRELAPRFDAGDQLGLEVLDPRGIGTTPPPCCG